MTRTIHTLILTLFVSLQCSAGSSDAFQKPKLNPKDSAQVRHYMSMAFQQALFSAQRHVYLDSALAIAPWYDYAWQQKAMPLYKQRKYELGVPYLDSAVKYNRNKHLEYRAFMKCIFAKDYKGAMKDFRDAYNENGNSGIMDHPYIFYMGLCHLQLNNFDSARILLQRSVDETTKKNGENWVHHMDWFYLGISFYELQDDTKAITCFDKCLKEYPQFCDAKYYKALCLAKNKNYKEASMVATQAGEDFKQGYSFVEDNSFYEPYPYQVNKFFLEGTVKWLKEQADATK